MDTLTNIYIYISDLSISKISHVWVCLFSICPATAGRVAIASVDTPQWPEMLRFLGARGVVRCRKIHEVRQTCIRIYTHTYIHTYITIQDNTIQYITIYTLHTYIRTYVHTYIQTDIHTYVIYVCIVYIVYILILLYCIVL